jgi:His-Xaa-Ser system protein HxsD
MEQQGIVEQLSPNFYRVTLSTQVYDREAVFAAAQRLNDRFYIKIEPHNEASYAVLLESKEEACADAVKAAHELLNDIIEEQVRIDLMKRTGALREIIYRHAFLPLEGQQQ